MIENVYSAAMTDIRMITNTPRTTHAEARSIILRAVMSWRVYAIMATVNVTMAQTMSTGGRLRSIACP